MGGARAAAGAAAVLSSAGERWLPGTGPIRRSVPRVRGPAPSVCARTPRFAAVSSVVVAVVRRRPVWSLSDSSLFVRRCGPSTTFAISHAPPGMRGCRTASMGPVLLRTLAASPSAHNVTEKRGRVPTPSCGGFAIVWRRESARGVRRLCASAPRPPTGGRWRLVRRRMTPSTRAPPARTTAATYPMRTRAMGRIAAR